MVGENHPAKPTGALALFKFPGERQLLLAVSLTISLLMAVAVFIWIKNGNFTVIYQGMDQQDAIQAIQVLSDADIPHRLQKKTGAILVPHDQVLTSQIKLAAAGITGPGLNQFPIQGQKSSSKITAFTDNVRYQRDIETKLARSIAAFKQVHSARVHIAIPAQPLLTNENYPLSASVFVELNSGAQLDDGQVAAIVHLLASSVNRLVPDAVTVVDQNGRLLTSHQNSDAMRQAAFESNYIFQIEQDYVERVENILRAVVDVESIRVHVVAKVDFISNPREQGKVYQARPHSKNKSNSTSWKTGRRRDDRPIARIKRISVVVLVNTKHSVDQQGLSNNKPREAAEIDQISILVKEAIGFEQRRGDSVNVINTAFTQASLLDNNSNLYWWDKIWLKQKISIISFGIIIILIYVLVRKRRAKLLNTMQISEVANSPNQQTVNLTDPKITIAANDSEYKQRLTKAKGIVMHDPKRVAKVVKLWIAQDD